MTFPFQWNRRELGPDDFSSLAGILCRTFREHLTCREVRCFGVGEDGQLTSQCSLEDEANILRLIKKKRPRTAEGGTKLFLPIWSGEKLVGVALVKDDGSGAFHQHTHAELQGISRRVSRELALLQDWATDPVTGLLNGRCFQEELRLVTGEEEGGADQEVVPFLLVLLEVFPRHHDAEQGLHYIARASGYIDSLVGPYSPLYHFGSGVFAMLWREADLERAMTISEGVLRWLRREGFGSVRIGIADCGGQSEIQGGGLSAPRGCKAETMLDQAWQALRRARDRGPFGLCTYASLVVPRVRRLTELEPAVLDQFKRLWSGSSSFAIALIHRDEKGRAKSFPKKVLALVGPDAQVVPLSEREAFVLLDGAGPAEARAWAVNFQKRVKSAAGSTFSVGCACYPCPGFRKVDIPLNACKALAHAAFLGKDSHALFDGVSCNISGDVFYNAGDPAGAVREYRRGLVLDPANVNIHNSLGVAYAQMYRIRPAIQSFEAALDCDPDNFMALFNLGFVFLGQGEQAEAVSCFERAVQVASDHFDLLLQLARLYCRAGKYTEALPLLEKALTLQDVEAAEVVKGALQRYLGETRLALGNNREAVSCLERATALNPNDAGAMSRLGLLYLQERQGDDIALSLCRQATELEAEDGAHWHRYGQVQFALEDLVGAEHSLRHCLRLERSHLKAALLLAQVHEKAGRPARAKKIVDKILRSNPKQVEARRILKKICLLGGSNPGREA